jgi:hypothetical protein
VQFLNPAILAGLLAAAIPIVLHFLSRRRVIELPFAPLRFLRPTQERQMKRMNLRRLLLLLIRIGIVVCVVLAAARPTMTGRLAGVVRGDEGVGAVLLVDDSASTQAQVSGGTVFDRIREEAVAIAREMGRRDEIAVLLFSDTTRPLFAEFVRDASLIASELARVQPGARPTDYVQALDAAFEWLDRSDRPHREIYVVGDLQEATVDSIARARLLTRMDAATPTSVYVRPVEAEPFVNRAVEPMQRQARLMRAGETVHLRVQVRQDGEQPLEAPVFLQLDENTVSEGALVLDPRGRDAHDFALTLPEPGDLGGSFRLRPDRYALDDELYFVLRVSDQVPVLVLRGTSVEEGERDPVLFLLSALDPDRDGTGRFGPRVDSAERFDLDELPRYPVLAGVNLRDLGAARLAALNAYLRGGGTLMLFAGDPRVRTYTNESLLAGWGPLRLGAFRGEQDVHERLQIVARDHPAFEGLEAEALATLEEVRLRNFYRLDEGVGRPLIRFAGGGAAVTEIEVGRGRVIVCGFDTSAISGDLPFSPMFLPLAQRLAGYLATAGWGQLSREFQVGQRLLIEAPDAVASATWSVLGPDGRSRDAVLDASKVPVRLDGGVSEQPGLYRFMRSGDVFATVAANVARSESERRWWSPRDFAEQFRTGSRRVVFAALEGQTAAEAVRAARSGTPVHRWFLVIAGILLVAESLLARRLGPTPSA